MCVKMDVYSGRRVIICAPKELEQLWPWFTFQPLLEIIPKFSTLYLRTSRNQEGPKIIFPKYDLQLATYCLAVSW